MDSYHCPKCGSKVVSEHRDEDNRAVDVWTACGSHWHREDSGWVQDGTHKAGWTTASAHTCGLVLALNAELEGVELERDRAQSRLREIEDELFAVQARFDRARRMLLATGMEEALVDAALGDPHG